MTLLAWLLIGIGASILLFIFLRHRAELAVLDVTTLAPEQERRTKERLAKERLVRSGRLMTHKVSAVFAPTIDSLHGWLQSVHERVMRLEKRYREEIRKSHHTPAVNEASRARALLEEADELMRKDRYQEAEQRCIQVVSLDAREPLAYSALGKIYLYLEQYEQARETLEFLLKLKPGNIETYEALIVVLRRACKLDEVLVRSRQALDIDPLASGVRLELAEVLFEMKQYKEAMGEMQKVVELEPANPKYLDFLIEASILAGDKATAESFLKKLTAVNPENQKIKEFAERLK